MTFVALNSAVEVIFFVSGPEKAAVLREALNGGAQKYPVQQLRPRAFAKAIVEWTASNCGRVDVFQPILASIG